MSKRLAKWLAPLVFLCVSLAAHAHDVPASIVMLDIGQDTIGVELQLPLSELGAALSEPLARAPDEVIPRFGARIERYVLDHLGISTAEGVRYVPHIESLSLRRTSNPNWVSNEWLIMALRMEAPAGALTERFTLDYDVILRPVVTHKALVFVRRDFRNGLLGENPQAIGMIAFQQSHLDVDGSDGSWSHGFAKIFSLGVAHIAEGTDHLLFLLALLLPAPLYAMRGRWAGAKSLRDSAWTIVRTVSGFTVGHSITLALGATGIVSVPSGPIEVLIAVSILISALHAWRPIFSGKELYLAAGFGLIHGLAFASTLSGLDFDGWTLALSLAGFNLGIEAMQLLVVAAVLPPLIVLSRTRAYGVGRTLGAVFAAACALGWIAERALGLRNPMAPLVDRLAAPPAWAIACLCATAFVASVALVRPAKGSL